MLYSISILAIHCVEIIYILPDIRYFQSKSILEMMSDLWSIGNGCYCVYNVSILNWYNVDDYWSNWCLSGAVDLPVLSVKDMAITFGEI